MNQQSARNLVELRENDIVIVVIGLTGVRKSTFVSQLISDSEVPTIGHTLHSETKYTYSYVVNFSGTGRIHLINTPGFDDSVMSDAEVLQDIAAFIAKTYEANVNLTGIVYMRSITDKRAGGTALRNINMFQRLLGERADRQVFLVTSRWDKLRDREIGDHRTEELTRVGGLWRDMHLRGSRNFPFDKSPESARRVVRAILDGRIAHTPEALRIQEELVEDRRHLDETQAGRMVLSDMEEYHQTRLAGLDTGGGARTPQRFKRKYDEFVRNMHIDYEQLLETARVRYARIMAELGQEARGEGRGEGEAKAESKERKRARREKAIKIISAIGQWLSLLFGIAFGAKRIVVSLPGEEGPGEF